MFALLHFYGGAITFESMQHMTMFEIDQAAIFMNEEMKREAKRNGAK